MSSTDASLFIRFSLFFLVLKWFSYENILLFSTAEHLSIQSILDTLRVETDDGFARNVIKKAII